MATRTVRLDEESERALEQIRRVTGLSASGALKRGLIVARDALADGPAANPFEVYRRIDLGPGGYARAPARHAKAGVRRVLLDRRRG